MSGQMPAHAAGVAELIERLLGDPELRRRFRTDPAGVMTESGLAELAAGLSPGNRALLTLELRESRSSLAGALVAAAAEGLDLAQLADHAAPALAHDADQAVERAISSHHHHPAPHHPPAPHHTPAQRPAPAAPSLGPQATATPLAPAASAHSTGSAGADQSSAAAGGAQAPASPVHQARSAPTASAASEGARVSDPAAGPASARGGSSGGAPVDPGNQPAPGSGSAHQPAPGSGSAQQPAPGSGSAPNSTPSGEPVSSGQQPAPGSSSATHSPPGGAPVSPGQQPAPGSASAPQPPPHADQTTPSAADPAATAVDPAVPASGYPGDQAAPQALAAWMGAAAQRAGLPPELPVMAALTESGLHNLSYGDRDSVGFFQMRLSIWDQGAYSGYPDHPELQLQWFIDHALAARQQDPALAQNPSSWGEWVANVEQPAAQYRYRYQLQLQAAQELLRGAELAPAPGAAAPVPAGQAALDAAMHLVNHAPTQPGAALQTGADPAHLVQYAYARQDVHLPDAAAEQWDVGIPVARQHLRPGDAVFFAKSGGMIDRVGLYAGHGRFVAAAPGGDVHMHSLDEPGLGEYVGARRYTAQALGNPTSYARPLPTVKP